MLKLQNCMSLLSFAQLLHSWHPIMILLLKLAFSTSEVVVYPQISNDRIFSLKKQHTVYSLVNICVWSTFGSSSSNHAWYNSILNIQQHSSLECRRNSLLGSLDLSLVAIPWFHGYLVISTCDSFVPSLQVILCVAWIWFHMFKYKHVLCVRETWSTHVSVCARVFMVELMFFTYIVYHTHSQIYFVSQLFSCS